MTRDPRSLEERVERLEQPGANDKYPDPDDLPLLTIAEILGAEASDGDGLTIEETDQYNVVLVDGVPHRGLTRSQIHDGG